MYSYSAMLCASSGGRFELLLAEWFGWVMLMTSGAGRGKGVVPPTLIPCGGLLVGKSAPCGLYASRVQIRRGRQIARRTGMTSVQQAVRRRNIPGAMTYMVLWCKIYWSGRLCGCGGAQPTRQVNLAPQHHVSHGARDISPPHGLLHTGHPRPSRDLSSPPYLHPRRIQSAWRALPD